MKLKFYFLFFLLPLALHAAPDYNRIADAIYKIENSPKYPYGIKSINTHGNKEIARRICLNTIKHNFAKWEKTKRRQDFLTFLANVYCPASADPVGNKNWIRNIHKILK